MQIYHKNPRLGMKVLQSLQSHPTGFQSLIFDLNSDKILEFLISSGTNLQVLGPRYDKVSNPYFTVLTLLVRKTEPLLRLCVLFLISNILLIIEDKGYLYPCNLQ